MAIHHRIRASRTPSNIKARAVARVSPLDEETGSLIRECDLPDQDEIDLAVSGEGSASETLPPETMDMFERWKSEVTTYLDSIRGKVSEQQPLEPELPSRLEFMIEVGEAATRILRHLTGAEVGEDRNRRVEIYIPNDPSFGTAEKLTTAAMQLGLQVSYGGTRHGGVVVSDVGSSDLARYLMNAYGWSVAQRYILTASGVGPAVAAKLRATYPRRSTP